MDKSTLIKIAATTMFRKLPFDMIKEVVDNTTVLETMNRYTQERYQEDFWLGGDAFNENYRLVCPPTAFDFVGFFPFMVKTVFLERTPFTPGVDSAKFGLHKKFTKPLLVY